MVTWLTWRARSLIVSTMSTHGSLEISHTSNRFWCCLAHAVTVKSRAGKVWTLVPRFFWPMWLLDMLVWGEGSTAQTTTRRRTFPISHKKCFCVRLISHTEMHARTHKPLSAKDAWFCAGGGDHCMKWEHMSVAICCAITINFQAEQLGKIFPT